MSTVRDPDQLAAALDEVFRLLCFAVVNPGEILPEHLGTMLRLAAAECERQGDYGAAQTLTALASQAEDNE